MERKNVLALFSSLLSYPEGEWKFDTILWGRFVRKQEIEATVAKEIELYFTVNEPASLQEYYVQTFDIQSGNHLYAGYALLGEDLRRGMLLSELKKEMDLHAIDLQHEIPDYLPKLIELLAVHPDEEFAFELCTYLILPALRRIIEAFTPAEQVYKKILILLSAYLAKEFKVNLSTSMTHVHVSP